MSRAALAGLTALALIAFAANSVLTRAALVGGQIGAPEFSAIRLVSGAVTLALLLALRGNWNPGPLPVRPALALLGYTLAFTFAYLALDTGTGALILFGMVQMTMFAGAVLSGDRPPLLRWCGAVLGFAGLVVLFLPGAAAPDPLGFVLMALAGLSWGIFSLLGRGVKDPLRVTGLSFCLAAPVSVLAWALAPSGLPVSGAGLLLAILSGAAASGLGYALWYAILPALGATRAAVMQLVAPLLAVAGGMLFLSEPLTLRFIIAALMVLGGVLLATLAGRRGA
ncbi:DMT family transporter [Oceanomicrobium pacificus]|uniref:EamA family transporter n=1 Tax=Oceanomicrobium pacificus TaxID=2692916 RepID=A0A6B0TNR6_9RHOB|nr:DMT family transporter [Oceanomicrobium pacificus]MXU64229.1 EamA family transporter [Oceanomicrobium pacificus]